MSTKHTQIISNSQFNSIEKYLNAILIAIRNTNKTKNYTTLDKEFVLLKLEDLFELELAKFMYNVKYQLLPVDVKEAYNNSLQGIKIAQLTN